MSEERFDRIEQRLDRLEAGQNELREDLRAQVGRLDGRLDGIDGRLDGIDGRLDGIDGRLDDLGRHMRVLHEETIDRIAATREYTGPTREEFAELKDMIGRRLDTVETVVREHSIEIARLKRRRR